MATIILNPLLTKQFLASLLEVTTAANDEVVDVLQQPMKCEGSTAAFAEWLPALLHSPQNALSTREESYRALYLTTVFYGRR